MSKVQFKLNVDPRIRDITAMHALQTGTDMSITIAKVVEEVLLPELTPASLAAISYSANVGGWMQAVSPSPSTAEQNARISSTDPLPTVISAASRPNVLPITSLSAS